MSAPEETYIPALRFRGLTRFYDPLLQASLREERFKRDLIDQACLAPGQRVLDIGCGTGTLTILAKQTVPQAIVVGIDSDPQALAIARRKAADCRVEIEFHEALAWETPLAPASFDRVLSSLFFHHLTPENKRKTLAHIHQLLKPDGELHVADWGRPQDPLMRLVFLWVQLLDGFETTADSVKGRLPVLMREAGFVNTIETRRLRTIFGTLSLLQSRL